MRDPYVPPSRLQMLLERLTDALRQVPRGFGRWPWRNRHEVIPVQVDLVGDSGVRQTISGPMAGMADRGEGLPLPGVNPFLRGYQARALGEAPANPLAGGSSADPATADDASLAWTFSEAVLLRRQASSSRVLLYIALGVSASGLLWLVLAPLNQTVAVQGKLEPDSKVKTVQAPVAGTVEAVLVEEGQSVRAGELLLRFDLREVRNRLEAAESIRTKLVDENRVLAISLGDGIGARGLSGNQLEQLRNQSADLSSRRDAAQQELLRSQVRLSGYRQALATATNIANRFSELANSGAVSEVQRLESQAKVDELRSRVSEEEREQERLQANLRSSWAGPGADLRGRIEANLRQIADLDKQIREARLQLQYGELRAPATGTVFDLEARRGTVAQVAEPILKVVPDEALRARVYVPSSAIGFIHAGQRADISLDTFPALEYGRLEATVERLGSDALTAEQQKETLGTEASGLHYPAVLRLSRQSLTAGRRVIPLQPGMGLTADIHLRQRRMLSVFTGFFEDKLRSLERMR